MFRRILRGIARLADNSSKIVRSHSNENFIYRSWNLNGESHLENRLDRGNVHEFRLNIFTVREREKTKSDTEEESRRESTRNSKSLGNVFRIVVEREGGGGAPAARPI